MTMLSVRTLFVARTRTVLFAVVCLGLGVRPAAALDPLKPIGQFMRTVWETSTGLPQNSVQAVLQTRDGYVWLGTEEGLVRFDGERFEVFNRDQHARTARQGRQVAVRGAGRQPVDRHGRRARTSEGREVHGVFARARTLARLDFRRSPAIAPATSGSARSAADCCASRTARQRPSPRDDGLPDNFVWAVRETRDGSIWIGTNGGLTRMSGDRLVTYTTRDGLPDNRVNSLWEDRDGSLWIGTAKGLVRSRGGKFETYTTRDGLSDDAVSALYEDAEGSLWIGTNGGVSRRTRRRIRPADRQGRTEPQLRRVADRGSRGQPLDRHERRRRHQADRSQFLDAVQGGRTVERSSPGRCSKAATAPSGSARRAAG